MWFSHPAAKSVEAQLLDRGPAHTGHCPLPLPVIVASLRCYRSSSCPGGRTDGDGGVEGHQRSRDGSCSWSRWSECEGGEGGVPPQSCSERETESGGDLLFMCVR